MSDMSAEETSSSLLDGELLSTLTYAFTVAPEPRSGRVHEAEMDFRQVLQFIMSDHLRLAARENAILHSCSTPTPRQGQVILEKQGTHEKNERALLEAKTKRLNTRRASLLRWTLA